MAPVDHQGGMINDPVLLKIDTDRFWLSIADSDVLLYALGLALGKGFDVEIDEPTCLLWPQGPKAEALLARSLAKNSRHWVFQIWLVRV